MTPLVSLPGLSETRRLRSTLEPSEGVGAWQAVPLQGRLSLESQRLAMAPADPGSRGKVVLAQFNHRKLSHS